MSLEDAIYLRKLSGTSSSGALPTSCEKSWEDQRYKESYIAPEIPKPSSDDLTAGLDYRYGLFTSIKNPSDVDLWLGVYLNYQDSSDLPNIPKLPNLNNTITNLIIWLPRAIRSSHADMPTQSSVGWSESKQQLQEILSVNNHILLEEMLSEIDDLLKNEYDWDEIDYIKPTPEDINYAKSVLTEFVTTIGYEGYSLTKPYISNSEDGGAKIEWHLDKRSLYLRIGSLESVATMIEDKPDGTTTIDDKPFLQKSYLSLWEWIING